MASDQHLDALIWLLAGEGDFASQDLETINTRLRALLEVGADPSVEASASSALVEYDRLQAGTGSHGALRTALRKLVGDPSKDAQGPETEEADADLMGMFLSSCAENLDSIEHILLSAESGALEADSLDELKRLLHTFKGECGVLSLGIAQRVCHEAESLIESVIASGAELPKDPLFEVLDWCRTYVESLGQDQGASPPDSHPLIDKLIHACDPAADEAGPAQAPAEAVASAPAPEPQELDPTPIQFPEAITQDETLPEFLAEANQHLEDAEAALLALDEAPDSGDDIDKIFRAFHTIKGVAGFLGLDPICQLAHSAESLLDLFRQGKLEFHQGYADIILQSKDFMASLLDALGGADAPSVGALNSMVTRVDNACDGLARDGGNQVVAPAAQAPEPSRMEGVGVLAAPAATPKAPAAAEPGDAAPAPAPKPVAQKEVQPKKPAKPAPKKEAVNASTIRVHTNRLDSLVDMVGELVIAQQMVFQDPSLASDVSEDLRRNLSQLSKITRDLQAASMSLRMVTFKSTFQKMLRLVRDVSNKAGKPCKLSLEGVDTEVDRNVVDKISDPLVHLLRNAIDHGIESTEDRIKAGKPAEGQVTLAARHQGGAINISIQDDGAGLNRDKILAKALEKGVVDSSRDLNDMSDSEVFGLIFQPGFSTAAQVTDISGRGVGMDVVRKNIEAMRGRVDIESVPGKGTTFIIQLPLTLAIIDAMVVRCQEERYVLPTLSIVQSFRAEPGQVDQLSSGHRVVDVRGKLIPVRPLQGALEGTGMVSEGQEDTLVLLESAGRRLCVGVDEILGQQQVVIKNLGEGLPKLNSISGGAILGDGRVALIVDPEELISESQEAADAPCLT